ncbi:hypothetical protein [Bartonella sp. CB169]|uniref:hypothetical protein n=1 Tax=Bartonella sp. CB169 TaxID=3112257 RepID=UPI00300DDCFD
MLKSFFSFVQHRALSLRPSQKTTVRAPQTQQLHAAFCLKYAKAYKKVAMLKALAIKELENCQKGLCVSCNNCVKTFDSLCCLPPVVQNKHSDAKLQTKKTNKATKKSSKVQKQTLLTWIQPGLAGLMDGSVSTLAPIFAAAFATGDTHKTFLIGLSSSIGAGLSMGFTEAAHDDGKLSGRGSPLKRGLASGIMTMLGGLGHALPYLINSFYIATVVAFIIVFFELLAIVWIQNKFMSTPFMRASLQVIIGGALVFATGILIGNI